jgi:ER lumen protein retaining receptor
MNRKSYDANLDNFNHYKYTYGLAAILTICFHTKYIPFELSWSFSIWLESVAILP